MSRARRGPRPGRAGPGGRPAGRSAGRSRSGSRARATPGPGRVRRTLGGEQVEGRQAVRELLLAGRRRVREVLVSADRDDSEILEDITELAAGLGVPVRQVSASRLRAEARTEAPQGVVARCAPLPEVDLDELLVPGGGQAPFLLLLDGITDPQNLGAALRSAECAGVTGVVLPRHRAVHVTPTVAKAAAGAIEYLPMALVGGLPSAIGVLRAGGVLTVGLDAGGERSLFELEVDAAQPIALVLGAEGRGLSRLVRQRCDLVAAIPLLGRLASLNVAAAGALACFEVARRRLAGPTGA